MSSRILKEIARAVIDAVSAQGASGTVINIIGDDGYIIASSDPGRVNTFHEGGKIAVDENRIVRITPGEKGLYAGAKEGINSPILFEGHVIGAVGIFGNPDEVSESAALLSVCVSLFLEQASRYISDAKRKERKAGILEILLSGNMHSAPVLSEKLKCYCRSVEFPLRIVLIRVEQPDVEYSDFKLYLENCALYLRYRDLIFPFENGFILLKQEYDDSLVSAVRKRYPDAFITLSGPCDGCGAMIEQFSLVRALAKVQQAFVADTSSRDDMAPLFLVDQQFRDRETRRMAKVLEKGITASWLRPSLVAYVAADGKMQKMADALGIHKNTAIYRMNSVFEVLSLSDASGFTRMLIILSILMREV